MKDGWDKTEIVCKIVSLIIIPIILALYANIINTTLKEKELNIKYLEVAVGILSRDPETTPTALRSWAVDILKTFSKEVPLNEQATTDLKNHPLPTRRYITDEKGNVITDEEGNPLTSE